jgi:hypothetical protein
MFTQQCIALLVVCASIPGCLLNSVHSITMAPQSKPDAAHAMVVIGMGLDVAWPYPEIQLTFPEYSVEKQRITGNCFHYNRIEVTRPSSPAKVTYHAFEVPANAYAYLTNISLAPSSIGHAFIAPPRSTVYFGDYVFVGNNTVEFRRNIDAAKVGAKGLLPRGAVLKMAESTAVPGVRMFICTP